MNKFYSSVKQWRITCHFWWYPRLLGQSQIYIDLNQKIQEEQKTWTCLSKGMLWLKSVSHNHDYQVPPKILSYLSFITGTD